MTDRIHGLALAAAETAVRLRHDLHRHPENAFREERTAGAVAERLRAFGLDVREGIAGTGVVGLVRGARPGMPPNIGGVGGHTVALRADMDALPILEQTDVPYRSETPGVMHACGHDGHTAILAGAAAVLAALRDEMAGSVKLIFQPAEEPVAGAKALCEAGVLHDPEVSAIVALHGWPGLPLGAIDASAGPAMASSDTFDIVVTGRGGHGAMPHLAVDPVVAAAQVVTALQSIRSREISPVCPVVVSVTSVQAGEAYNVIPEEVRLKGTVRALDPEVRAEMPGRIRRIAEGVCAAYGAAATVEYRECCPVTVNDAGVCALIREAAEPMLGAGNVRSEGEPTMGAEDFSCYVREVPGALFRLGLGDVAPVHNPRFDFPDAAIPVGIELMARIALRMLAA